MAEWNTRAATLADAAAIATIYNEGIADRIATFETEPRSAAQIAEWFTGRPLVIVAESEATEPVAIAASFAYSPRPTVKRVIVVGALGTAQTLAWGSSYYLPAILDDPIAHGVGVSRTTVFGLFSAALLVSAVLGPSVGRVIDNRGGRGVLALSNLVLAMGLVLLGAAQGFITLALAWGVLGIGMAMGLYDPAFATLTGLYGRAVRGPITGITLIAGFASTVGWPLSAFLDAQFGWRAACLTWAGAVTAFAVLHDAGSGLLTIAKGTVPLAIFGPVGYGRRSGILGVPARATQAASPLLFGVLMDHMGIGVLAISAGLSLSAFFALLILRARPTAAPAPA